MRASEFSLQIPSQAVAQASSLSFPSRADIARFGIAVSGDDLVNLNFLIAGWKPLLPSALGMAALASTACTLEVTRDGSARILASQGAVTLSASASSSSPPRAVAAGAEARQDEVLQTGPDGSASLMILPGMLVQLHPGSSLQVEKVRLGKNGNATDEAMSRFVQLRLLKGTVDVVLEFEPQPRRWQILTAYGALTSVRPGTCRLRVTETGARLDSLRGEFAFGSEHPVPVAGGYFLEVPSVNRNSIPVETDPAAQENVVEMLAVERNLLELQNSERLSPFPWRRLGLLPTTQRR